MNNLVSFFRIFSWFSLRYLNKSKWRIVAVIVGIAIGAAVFSSVRLAVDASLQSFRNSMNLISGSTDYSIIRPGGMVPDRYITRLILNPYIKSVSPISTAYVLISVPSTTNQHSQPGKYKKVPVLLVGIDPILDRNFHHWKVVESPDDASPAWIDLISQPYSVIISSRLAREYQVKRKEQIVIDIGNRKMRFTTVGVLSPEGLGAVQGGYIAITDISTMQEFTGKIGLVDKIDIRLESHEKEKVLQALKLSILPQLQLVLPGDSKESGDRMIRSYQLNLSVLSFVSLFVGMFLVYSLVSLNATSRRHELSVLRSLGSSRKYIFFLFIGEGLVLGTAGWLLSVPLSSILVKKLIGVVSTTISNLFVSVEVTSLHFSPAEVLFSAITTVGVSIFAAYFPALQAMKVQPGEALTPASPRTKRRKHIHLLGATSVAMILLVLPLALLPPVRGVPLPGYLATFCLFSGFSLITPYVFHKIGNHLPEFFRKAAGTPAFLAGRYLKDAENRVAVSVGALITAVALFVGLVIMVHSFRNTMKDWVRQSISGDIFIRPKMAELNRYRFPLPRAVVDRLRHMKSEVDLLPYNRVYLKYNNIPYQFEAIDMAEVKRHVHWIFLHGDMDKIFPALLSGKGVVVSEVFSNTTGLHLGDTFTATIKGVLIRAPILGIIRDYRTRGGIVYYSLKSFERLSGESRWNGLRVFVKDRKKPDRKVEDLIKKLINCCPEAHNVSITAGRTLRKNVLRIFEETFAITTVLLVIALVVASLSIATTLSVLILERKVQLSTLLAIGASKRQIRNMIFWESIWMVLVGQFIGTICGFALSYLLIFVINKQSFGWTFVMAVQWRTIIAAFPLVLLAALAAAIPAIKIASSIQPALALRNYYEVL